MTCKVTFFLNAIRAATYNGSSTPPSGVAGYRGISESWYTDSVFRTTEQYNDCIAWMTARVPMMPINSTIVAFRVQEMNAIGKTITYRAPKVGSNGFIQDLSEAALKYKVNSTSTASERTVPIAMIPDDIIRGGVYASASDWLGYATAFFKLVNEKWKIKIIKQDVPTGDVISIDALGNVLCNTVTDVVAESKVQILRSKTEEGNTGSGVYKLQGFTNNKQFRLLGWEFGATELGQARRFVQEYNQVECFPQSLANPTPGTRKIGRPFDQSRGKASKKR